MELIQTVTKSILILVAMDVEEKSLVQNYQWTSVPVSCSLKLTARQMKKNGSLISVLNTGVGMVNAGAAVALFSDKYPLSEVILLGVGGGISETVKAGDTVIGTSVTQYDSVFSNDSGEELMTPGELFLSLKPETRSSPVIKTDLKLTDRLSRFLHTSGVRGSILSGSEFVGSKKRKLLLSTKYPDALLVEMESAGIAQIAKKLGVPFAVFKTVADEANPKSTVSGSYMKWLESAALKAHSVLAALISEAGN